MHMFKTEESLLTAIINGQTQVDGSAVHTFRLLLSKKLVFGVFDGDSFFDVIPTPEGEEVASSFLAH